MVTSVLCAICGRETGEPWERFMIHDHLWIEACENLEEMYGQHQHLHETMLCLGCTEEGLGRKLTPSDFKDVPLNDWRGMDTSQASERLLDRLGVKPITSN